MATCPSLSVNLFHNTWSDQPWPDLAAVAHSLKAWIRLPKCLYICFIYLLFDQTHNVQWNHLSTESQFAGNYSVMKVETNTTFYMGRNTALDGFMINNVNTHFSLLFRSDVNLDFYFLYAHGYNNGLRQLSDLIVCRAFQFIVDFKGQSPWTDHSLCFF